MLVYNDSNFQLAFDKHMKYLDSVFFELTCIFPRISKHVRNSHRIVLRKIVLLDILIMLDK